MARKYNDRYVRFYTFGSAAAELEQERTASLPKYKKPPKRKPIPFDPVAFAGTAVAVLLAVLMVVGFAQVTQAKAQVRDMQAQILELEMERELLEERYENGYDLNEIRTAAISMGMIPAEEADSICVETPDEIVEIPQVGWWESIWMGLREFFA